VILISLLVFAITGQAGAKDFIWCLGEDGQSRLELSQSDSCNNTEQDHHHDQKFSSIATEEDNCGPCLDIETSFEKAFNLSRDKDTLPDEVLTPVFGSNNHTPGLSHPANYTVSFQLPPPWVSQTLLKHRTVVLLN